MIYLKRLTQDCFSFHDNTIYRRFPEEYLLGLDQDEVTVIGYAKLNLLTNQLLQLTGPAELLPELRKYVIWLFREMGEDVLTDVSGTLPVRIDLTEER
ncbi:MAG: hypothetical protein GX978_08445 [Tissierellia bacterium]|jgi:hypothetical protein|nr:hypothetical protein [Tissierellia bacterium]